MCSSVLQYILCCGNETKKIMEAFAEHDFCPILARWNALHNVLKNTTVRIYSLYYIVLIVCEIYSTLAFRKCQRYKYLKECGVER